LSGGATENAAAAAIAEAIIPKLIGYADAYCRYTGSIVKRLHRNGAVENIGAGRASKWKLAGA
jgi:hypothetical protein